MTIPVAPPAPSDSPEPKLGGRGVVYLAWVAIGFGVLASPGALILIPGIGATPLSDLALASSNTAPVLATISWLLAILASAIAGARLRRRSHDARLAFALAAPGAVLGTVAIVLVVITIGNMLGLFQRNAAEDRGTRVVDHYLEQDASLVCTDGNNGYGINGTPWYQAYIDAPATLGTEAQAKEALERAGYFGAQRTEISDYYDLPENTGAFAVESLEAYTPDVSDAPTYTEATVEVFPEGPLTLHCTRPGGGYGDELTPADGRVFIAVQITLEPTR